MGIKKSIGDWFDRDKYSYTSRFKSKIGWEKSLDEEDSYSSYFWRPKNNDELIKQAYFQAKDMILVINPPFKVNIKISNDESSFTNGRTVCISTKIFDEASYDSGEKLDIFCGLTIHEGCHLLFTTFKDFQRWVKKDPNPVKKFIFNVIEDERIEEKLAEDKPGLIKFIEKLKYYYFDELYLRDHNIEKTRSFLNTAEELLDIFLSIIRYPKYITDELIESKSELFEDIKKLVSHLPNNTKETIVLSEKIYELLLKYYKLENSLGLEKSPGVGSGLPDHLEKMFIKDLGKLIKGSFSAAHGDPKYGEDGDSPDAYIKADEISRSLSGDGGRKISGELEGRIEFGSDKKITFDKKSGGGGKIIYDKELDLVKKYIPFLRNSLKFHSKNYSLIHRGCRSGILDTDKLSEAYQGVPHVYIRKGEVKTKRISVCLVIDESGSMAGYGDHSKAAKSDVARKTAILLNEVFKEISGMDLFIYGHTADSVNVGTTEINVYREGKHKPKYSLSEIAARNENRDGVALLDIAKRVRKNTEDQVLMFILSDGQPSACNYREEIAIEDTKNKVKQIENMGFSVVQICIDCNYDPGTMFKNYIIMTDLDNLARDLSKTIKKAVQEAAEITIS